MNQATAQALAQRGQIAGFNNQAAQQEWQNAVTGTQYGNELAQRGFGNATNLAQLQDTQRERAIQEMLLPRNQAINEIGAIQSGSQVQNPQFTPYQSGRVSDTPLSQNVYASAALANQASQIKAAEAAAGLGGLFGLAGTGLTAGMRYGFPTFGMTG